MGEFGSGVDRTLQQYREHMTLLLNVLPVIVYRARGMRGPLWVSENAQEITGFSPDELIAEPAKWFGRIHADDQEHVARVFSGESSSAIFTVEYRWHHADGHYIWFLDHGRRVELPGGASEAFGVALDTTARREMQEQRRWLLDELINAQEVERRRISRELHDALGQTMTSLSMCIAALEELNEAGRDVGERLADLRVVAHRAASELSELAHSLRPPAIDELGFVAALHGLVSDFAAAHRLAVDVHVRGLDPSGRMAPSVETCLYRMVQEALNNVVKHSGAERVSVILDRRDNRVQLIVEDDGRGFDAAAVDRRRRNGGLGLAGMRERAAILGGDVAIESRPGGGTTVRVTVPKA